MNIPAITTSLSALFTAIETPLANHLWQSTLFAAAAGVLTLTLKKNSARVRYWLWLAASVKFLVPFSLLAWLGSQLRTAKPAAPAPDVVLIVQQIAQPFAPAQAPHAAQSIVSHWLPMFLLAIWVSGSLAVLCLWWLRWRRVTRATRQEPVANAGRELEILRYLEPRAGMPGRVRLILSRSAMEPGLLGIFHPTLLLPAGVAERLSDAQLETIITHELCHVRRRDNLTATIHMFVEAVFWFHPLVWWMGARLVHERERACDEDVLRLGSEPQVYAQSILKVCEFYLESPLVCVAGITGSNLKRRIEAIMVHRMASKLHFGKKLVLAIAAFSAVAIPVVAGLLHPAASAAQAQAAPAVFEFESVSLKLKGVPTGPFPQRFLVNNGQIDFVNMPLKNLITYAYQITDSRISGGPAWMASEFYDLQVSMKPHTNGPQYRLAVQKILADRFKLAAHREMKQLPALELSVGRNGSKLTEVAAAEEKKPKMEVHPVGQLEANAAKMRTLVDFLEVRTGLTIVDKTGLNGLYDFKLDVSSLTPMGTGPMSPEGLSPLTQALSEQLGLQLTPTTTLGEVLVIDHVEKATSNE
jgi:bla regulator protein BlaR1